MTKPPGGKSECGRRIDMSFWVNFWKAIFLFSLFGFAILSVWVTISGARDIRSMLDTILAKHEQEEE